MENHTVGMCMVFFKIAKKCRPTFIIHQRLHVFAVSTLVMISTSSYMYIVKVMCIALGDVTNCTITSISFGNTAGKEFKRNINPKGRF